MLRFLFSPLGIAFLTCCGPANPLDFHNVLREKKFLISRAKDETLRRVQQADDSYYDHDGDLGVGAELWYCERAAAKRSSANTTCSCHRFDDGVLELSCLGNCLFCGNPETSSCGQFTFAANVTTDGIAFNTTSYATRFQYDGTGGRNELISMEETNCNEIGECSSCHVLVNGTFCNGCTLCPEGAIVDCENVVEGSSFNSCLSMPGSGLFQGLSYEVVDCVEPPPPPNDNCTNATFIIPGEIVSGTLTSALGDILPSCLLDNPGTRGVWYSFAGTGSPMLVSSCSFSQSDATWLLTVYQGSGCDLLQCAIGASKSSYCPGYAGGSSILLPTQSKATYYVYVGDWLGSSGSFDLRLTKFVQQSNNRCSGASEISIDDSPVIGSIQFGSRVEIAICDAGRADDVGVAWYRFEARRDATLRASTCASSTIGWRMSAITIASGSCNELFCVDQREPYAYFETCSDGGTFVDFQVNAGTSYYIALWGNGYGNVALLELDIRSLTPPVNDNCENAQRIDVQANFTATFKDITVSREETDGVCFEHMDSSNGGGIWYSFVGTGDIVVATACSNHFSPYLTMYTGSCAALQCVSPVALETPWRCSSFRYGKQSTPIETKRGTLYHVLVSGSGPISGSFEFGLRTVPPIENDRCRDAFEIKADGQVIIGNTDGAIYEDYNYSCPYDSRSPGVWYVIVGNGGMLRADTCSPATNFDTVISVYRGSCEDLQCVGANDDGCQSVSSSFMWDTEVDETYYILVSGLGDGLTGDYGFKVAPWIAAINDRCEGATRLSTGEFSGTIEGALSLNEHYSCYGGYDRPTLWYYIDGTGTALKVSTCSANSTFYAGIQAFGGTTCVDLECVGPAYEDGGYSDNDCPYPSAATWFFAEEGLRYYILLVDDSFGGANSVFTLNVTPEFPLTSNDVCETAFPFTTTGNDAVHGSTAYSMADNITCAYYSSNAPGVWYSFVGTGNAFVASTCSGALNFDAMIYILAGKCDALDCVAFGRLGYSSCGDPLYGERRAAFTAEAGVQYFIVVTGSSSSAFGEFDLSLSEIVLPPNDVCSEALEITPNSGVIVGSLSNATSFFGSNYSCAHDSSALSVWYYVIGTGDVLAISTCSSHLKFDSAISISTGSCDDHVCVPWHAYNTNFFHTNACPQASYSAARVSILTEVGVVYFIAVEGLNVQAEGDFGLSVSTLQAPVNDECPGAILIQPASGTISGSIAFATGTHDYNTTSCSYIYDAPDVWYTLIGTGAVYAVSTCSSVLNFDASISISRGSCDLQECVLYGTYGNSGCTESSYSASRAVFRTEVGVVYFIAVQGANYPSEGDFTLEFSPVETPPNDECLGAIVIAPDNTTIRGSLVNATAGLNASCDFSLGAPGVWFSMIGTGEVYLISTCSSELTFDSALSVSTGSCKNQTCIAYGVYNDYECTETTFLSTQVLFNMEVGVEYHIHVQSLSSSSVGDFELHLSTVVVPVNDACSGAISIPVGTESVLGSISNATGPPIFSRSCSYSNDVPDVWYTMIGTGDVYAVSTCSNVLDFESALSVSSGSCSTQDCFALAANNDETCDNGSYTAARVLFRTELGVEYFIAVQGVNYPSEGNFELQISTVAVPPNDECTGALLVVPGGGAINGSTSLATYSGTNSSCSSSDNSPDVWYRVEGTGTMLTASTCGERTNYDSQISIFQGVDDACDTTCIASNDDFCDIASQVEWMAGRGVTYYVRIHGYYTTSGSFVLRVT